MTAKASTASILTQHHCDNNNNNNNQQQQRVRLQSQAKQQALAHQLDEAIVSYHKLLSESNVEVSPVEYSAILSNIAVLYRKRGKPAEALRIYRQAIQVMEARNKNNTDKVVNNLGVADRLHLFQIYQNEASLYRYLEDDDSSFDVYQKMLVLIDGIVEDLDKSQLDDMAHNERRRRYHHLSVQAKASYGRLHNTIGNLYYREGEHHRSLDHFIQSIEWFEGALDVGGKRSSLYGTSDIQRLEMIEPLSSIAKSYLSQHDLQKALKAWEDALKILREEVEADNPMILAVLSNLAVVHDLMGNQESAHANQKRILAIRSDKLGDNHCETSMSMIHMGNILLSEGKLDEATNTFSKALTNFRNTFDHFHPYVAGALYCIGNVHYKKGQFQKALEQFEEACLIRKSTLGELDSSVADVQIAIGQAFRRLGRKEDAMQSFNSALRIFEEHGFRNHHPSVQKALSHVSPNTADDIISPNEQGFVDEKTFGDSSQSTNASEFALLDNLIESGKFRQASTSTSGQISEATESLSTHNHSEQPEYTQQPFSSEDIVSLVSNGGKKRIDRALAVFIEKLRSQESSIGSNQNEIANTFVDIGDIFFERGDSDKSIKLYQEALLLQPQEIEFAITLGKLADVYVKKGLYEQALESYGEALEMYRSVNLSEDHIYIERILKSISDTLDEEQRCF